MPGRRKPAPTNIALGPERLLNAPFRLRSALGFYHELMRKRSFVLAVVVFLVLAAAAYAVRRDGGGLLKRLAAIHGPQGH